VASYVGRYLLALLFAGFAGLFIETHSRLADVAPMPAWRTLSYVFSNPISLLALIF
jgi:hypothetical protein